MMNNFFPFGGFGGFGIGLHLHFLFGALVLIGLILFTIWALRSLKNDQLVKWIQGLLIVGLIGWLLTSVFAFGWLGKAWQGGNFGRGMMQGFGNCLQDQDCNNGMQRMMNYMNQSFENNAR